MGIDFEKGTFSDDQHELSAIQTERLIIDIEPGEVAIFDLDDFWVDAERKIWIDGYGCLYDSEDTENSEIDSSYFGRIIKIDSGIILDLSHFDKRNWLNGDKFSRSIDLPNDSSEEPMMRNPIPVIHLIMNLDELELVERILKNYNVSLDDVTLETAQEELIMADDFSEDEDDGISLL